MSHKQKIKLSRPDDRDYNVFGVNEGEDVSMSIPIEHDDWINSGYNVTIYDEKDGTTLASVSVDEDPTVIVIDDFSFDSKKCLVTIEDRSDINNIETEESIGYLFFKKFKRGTTTASQDGFINVRDTDDSQIAVPYYSTGFQVT